MTTGHLLFYGGIALFVFTVILAIIFALKKPKYEPASAACAGGDGGTQKLRSGYPTDRLTIRREPVIPGTTLLGQSPAAPIQPATERLAQGTEVLPATERLAQGTEVLPATERLAQGTEVLTGAEQNGTTPLT